jgi:hypothetical protein
MKAMKSCQFVFNQSSSHVVELLPLSIWTGFVTVLHRPITGRDDNDILCVLQSAHQKVLSKLAQYEQQLKEESENHQQEIISIEREHQEKVLPYLISYPHMDFSFPSIHRLRPLICNTK